MTTQSNSTSMKPYLPLLLVLGSVTCFGPLSIDMYLPAFPQISTDFGVSLSQVELTLAIYFLGLASGQIFYGPLADRYGRRKPLLAGVFIYVLASFFCATANSIESLIFFRFLQSLGSCAGMVISRAVVRDMFKPQESARVFSTLMLITAAAPILAPIIGGFIIQYFNWHWLFYILTFLSSLALIGVYFFLPETATPNKDYQFKHVFKTYLAISKDKKFLGYALAGGAAQAGMFAYITGSPFVFIEYFGIPSKYYGFIFGTNAFALITAAQINSRLVQKIELRKIFKIIFLSILFAGFALTLMGLIATHFLMIAIPLFFYIGIMGMVFPNTTAAALSDQGKNAGSASALIGSIQFSCAALASTIVSALHATTPVAMTSVMGVCGTLSFLFYYFIVVKKVNRVSPSDLNQTPVA